MVVGSQLHAPAALPLGKEPPNIHWIGGWMGLSEKLVGAQPVKILPIFTSVGCLLHPKLENVPCCGDNAKAKCF